MKMVGWSYQYQQLGGPAAQALLEPPIEIVSNKAGKHGHHQQRFHHHHHHQHKHNNLNSKTGRTAINDYQSAAGGPHISAYGQPCRRSTKTEASKRPAWLRTQTTRGYAWATCQHEQLDRDDVEAHRETSARACGTTTKWTAKRITRSWPCVVKNLYIDGQTNCNTTNEKKTSLFLCVSNHQERARVTA